jgi:hypothetical protein
MPQNIFPYFYLAYGLHVKSQVPVTGFLEASGQAADVTISIGQVPKHLPETVNRGVLFESNSHEFLLHIEKVASFHVLNGNEVRIQPDPTGNPDDISAFISGTVFGALMHQRGMLPVHASTVLWQDKCIVFSGNSGSGKSTLAASFILSGARLLADDISVIGVEKERPEVKPAFPMMRMWQDSLHHLGISNEKLKAVRAGLQKYYFPVNNFVDSPRPIDHFFILSSHNRDEIITRSVIGVDKFKILKRHTYLFRGIRDTVQQQQHFVLVNRLAVSVPVTLVTRPNSDFTVERLQQCITRIVKPG